MLENEEPWMPPKPQNLATLPAISCQVPEITILNTAEKISDGNYKKFSATNKFSPTVPDLSIINQSDDNNPKAFTKNRILTQSYKEMLVKTHDQIKQNRIHENPDVQRERQPMLRQGLLAKTQKPYEDYKPNPLCKYVPSKIIYKEPSSPHQGGNLSSILIDTSHIPSSSRESKDQSLSEESDHELQFKNVAGIISEIQKLVTPSKVDKDMSCTNGAIHKLAKLYLTEEEYLHFAVDEEFCNESC
jgi:hypothetical protein